LGRRVQAASQNRNLLVVLLEPSSRSRRCPAGALLLLARLWRQVVLEAPADCESRLPPPSVGPKGHKTACTIRKSLLTGFRPVKMSDRRLSDSLLPGQNLFGLSEQRNTEVVQLLRTLQLS